MIEGSSKLVDIQIVFGVTSAHSLTILIAEETVMKKQTGTDKYGYQKSGKRSFAATLYGKKNGATTSEVKTATLKKYGKGYPMLNMLRKLDGSSKAWKVTTTQVTNTTSGRENTKYAIVKR